MSSRKWTIRIQDILDAIEKIAKIISTNTCQSCVDYGSSIFTQAQFPFCITTGSKLGLKQSRARWWAVLGGGGEGV